MKTKQKKNTVVKAPKVEMDIKDFGIGAQILHDLDIHKLRLISNGKKEKRGYNTDQIAQMDKKRHNIFGSSRATPRLLLRERWISSRSLSDGAILSRCL